MLKLQLWNVIILGLFFLYHLAMKLLVVIGCTRLNTTLMVLFNDIILGGSKGIHFVAYSLLLLLKNGSLIRCMFKMSFFMLI